MYRRIRRRKKCRLPTVRMGLSRRGLGWGGIEDGCEMRWVREGVA
jgi:hypothetical protein